MKLAALVLSLLASRADAGAIPALIEPQLWTSLPAPAADRLDWLSSRLPTLPKGSVRELSFNQVDRLLGEAVVRGYSALDIFSDSGLLSKDQLFYMSQDTVAKAYAKYRIRSLAIDSAVAKDGKPFHMQGIVMGAGRIEMLYDRGGFEYDNPDYTDHVYRCSDRVTQTIQGPGDLTVEGISVSMLIHPKIQRFTKLPSGKLRIQTNWGSQERPIKPVAVKSAS